MTALPLELERKLECASSSSITLNAEEDKLLTSATAVGPSFVSVTLRFSSFGSLDIPDISRSAVTVNFLRREASSKWTKLVENEFSIFSNDKFTHDLSDELAERPVPTNPLCQDEADWIFLISTKIKHLTMRVSKRLWLWSWMRSAFLHRSPLPTTIRACCTLSKISSWNTACATRWNKAVHIRDVNSYLASVFWLPRLLISRWHVKNHPRQCWIWSYWLDDTHPKCVHHRRQEW